MNQVLRDQSGRKIGEISDMGSRQVLRDEIGRKLGEFDGKVSRDDFGRKVGEGNLLAMLLKKK